MNCRSLLILLMHCIGVGLAQGSQEERNYNKIVAGRISEEGLPSGIRSFSLGYSNGRLLAFAGRLTDSKGDLSFSPHVFARDLDAESAVWDLVDGEEPKTPRVGGAVASGGEWIYQVGGEERAGASKAVSRLRHTPDLMSVDWEYLPDLPSARKGGSAVVYSDTLYFVSESDSDAEGTRSEAEIWALSLKNPQGWDTLPLPETGSLESPLLVVQRFQKECRLYLIDRLNGREPLRVFLFDEQGARWLDHTPDEANLNGGADAAAAIGFNHILIIPSNASDSRGRITEEIFLTYHTITQTWSPLSRHDALDFAPRRLISTGNAARVVAIGQTDRIPDLATLEVVTPGSGVHPIDFLVVLVYLGALVLVAYYCAKRNKNTDDYFRAGKRIPSWASALSIIATSLSAISVMAVPALVYATNWNYYLFQVHHMLGIFVAGFIAVPLFYGLNIITYQEFVARRYGELIRVIGSVYSLFPLILTSGAIILLPSMLISGVTGMNLDLAIIIMGIMATAYTIAGGLEAVIWTDVVQLIVFVGGAFLSVVVIAFNIDINLADGVSLLYREGKLDLANFQFTLQDITLWGILLALPTTVLTAIGSQDVIQRFVCNPNVNEAKKSVRLQFVYCIFIFLFFYTFGSALFVFYHSDPSRIPIPMGRSEEIVPIFIVRELPLGISGLLLAAIFAATMSTIDSRIHSGATILIRNLYLPYVKAANDHDAFRYARWLVGILGVFITLSAIAFNRFAVQSVFELFFDIIAVLSAGYGSILLAIFTKKANQTGALIAWGLTIILNICTKFILGYHFIVVGIISFFASIVLAYGFSLLFPERRPRDLTGLTWWSRTTDQRTPFLSRGKSSGK